VAGSRILGYFAMFWDVLLLVLVGTNGSRRDGSFCSRLPWGRKEAREVAMDDAAIWAAAEQQRAQ
jgi:hypothetical protein